MPICKGSGGSEFDSLEECRHQLLAQFSVGWSQRDSKVACGGNGSVEYMVKLSRAIIACFLG